MVQMRCGLTFSISATRLTGISRSIKANAKASNNKVKPLPGRAQGTSTTRTFPSVSGGGNPRKDGCKNPLFYNWGSAPIPAPLA